MRRFSGILRAAGVLAIFTLGCASVPTGARAAGASRIFGATPASRWFRPIGSTPGSLVDSTAAWSEGDDMRSEIPISTIPGTSEDGGGPAQMSGGEGPSSGDTSNPSYRKALMRPSAILGIVSASAELDIRDSNGASVEKYRSNGDVAPELSYYWAPKELAVFNSGSGVVGIWVIDISGSVGGFSGRQTQQKNPDGSLATGKLGGDYAYAGAGTSLWIVHDDEWIPVAARAFGAIGFGTLDYSGDLNHASGSQASSARIQNNGTSVQAIGFAGLEIRAAQVSLTWKSVQYFDNGDSELVTPQGLHLASYHHTFSMEALSLGYAFSF